ncbi:MAG: hypothetical protein KKD07_09280 [Candidatus Omnitrophica bacterium]|nr:hypothetical protein [Candidatus Omnitrophota bacterium]MBU1996226.1 hypothetical protein [Candidatus Omnitrophota bacterium]MBU4334618.1 hypothetical protein [Candidatus Omnitrophota bacterium]
MYKYKLIKNLSFVMIAFVALVFPAKTFSWPREGSPEISQGKYFSITLDKGIDAVYVAEKLNYDYLLHPESALDLTATTHDSILAKTLDSLYLEVSDILDLHSYNYHGSIHFVKDQAAVRKIFAKYFGKEFSERSFFLQEENIIFISSEDLTLGMLGHEIAHAIICHYFVAPPPTKTQEVLAGYVEYSLRKKAGSLPVIINQ